MVVEYINRSANSQFILNFELKKKKNIRLQLVNLTGFV